MIQKTAAALRRHRTIGNKNTSRFLVEGSLVSYKDIASRLGVPYDEARKRMAKFRAVPGAITWKILGART